MVLSYDDISAVKSVYAKLQKCVYAHEAGKRAVMSPTDNETSVLMWAVQEFAKKNGVNLYGKR